MKKNDIADRRIIGLALPDELNKLLDICQSHGLKITHILTDALIAYLPTLRTRLAAKIAADRELKDAINTIINEN